MADIELKTAAEIARLRKAATLLHQVFASLEASIRAGADAASLEHAALAQMRSRGLTPTLQGYEGYPHHICVSVNNIAAHGVPGSTVLQPGDIVTVDLSADLAGYKADSAWTYLIPPIPAAARRLARVAWQVTMAGVHAARGGTRMGDVAAAIAQTADRLGCRVIRRFTGHGIGRSLHEEPAVPNHGDPDTGVPIVPGMVLNIEPVVTTGSGEVRAMEDGWSYITSDGAPAAQYELTVAVRSAGPQLLNSGESQNGWSSKQPPFW